MDHDVEEAAGQDRHNLPVNRAGISVQLTAGTHTGTSSHDAPSFKIGRYIR